MPARVAMPVSPLPAVDSMTIAEFLAFTDTRPDEERWELIEGVPTLSPSPVDCHQIVCSNILFILETAKRQQAASWLATLGVGTRVPASPDSLPRPDVYVMAKGPTGAPVTDDALVLFEVLSRSNTKADQAWRRKVYASVPNCKHYVTVSLKKPEAIAYDRASGWQPRRAQGIAETLALAAIGVELPLADVYRYTPLAR
jgi:Uma2 family endonuclease